MTGSNSQKQAFISRNGGTAKGFNSDWRSFLISNASLTTVASERDAEMQFLAAKGFTQPYYYDRLSAYLASKGFSTGTINDRYQAWLATGLP